jgi:hypothetical protein
MLSESIEREVYRHITDFPKSRLKQLVDEHGKYVIKFVNSQWADHYQTPKPLKISAIPALTWGTATYVTPLAFPLSSALYGRIGLVTKFDPENWKIFDATEPAARTAYIRWARAQPVYTELMLTVHSTHANHQMRNVFRESFKIDCVLFHPDQEAEVHTDRTQHVWMAVTDWLPNRTIDNGMSARFAKARFTVLIDEDFPLQDNQGLPVQTAMRRIERAADALYRAAPSRPVAVPGARNDPKLPATVVQAYKSGGYVHIYIVP